MAPEPEALRGQETAYLVMLLSPLAVLANSAAAFQSSLSGLDRVLADFPAEVMIDHMGRPDIAQGPEGVDITAFKHLLDTHLNIWTKVSGAERLSIDGPPFDELFRVR